MAGREHPMIQITNEFTTVCVRKVDTRNGVRLEIASPRLGYCIQLDALALESLTWQTPDTFSRFLETPFGPQNRTQEVREGEGQGEGGYWGARGMKSDRKRSVRARGAQLRWPDDRR